MKEFYGLEFVEKLLEENGWTNKVIACFGSEAIKYDRYPKEKEPFKDWGFIICQRV
jgi:hypothetical protein